MKNRNFLLAALFAVAAMFSILSCQKAVSDENVVPPGKEQLSLYLTDGPGLFDQVLIEIKSVKVLIDTTPNTRKNDHRNWDWWGANDHKRDSGLVWETLNIQAGIYDVLKLRNGADTILSNSTITKGSIRLIKIELGTNNSLVKDSISYPLNLFVGTNNYVLIKLLGHECDEYKPGKKRLWLDFDVTRSVIEKNNQFYLKPFFHFFVVANTGSISGKVGPKEAYPVVTVFNASDTAYALPNRDGYFKVRGIPSGTYSVYINASNGYADTTITNVSVNSPKETQIGTIKLHK
jgi:hypothetical protein